MSSDSNSSDSDDASSEEYHETEEELEDVIPNPQNEDDIIDNQVFREAKWGRNAYNYVIGLIKKAGHTDISCTSKYVWPRSETSENFHIERGTDHLNLSTLNNEYKSIEDNEELCARIGKHCFDNGGIKYLHLKMASLEREGITGFFRHWEGGKCQLLGLDLDAPNVGDDGRLGGVGVTGILEHFLRNNTTLKELHLNWTMMNLDNARALAGILSNESTIPLVHVGLAENMFGDEGVELLSRAIGNIPTVETVNFAETGISKYSSISPLLHNSLCSLKRLNISNPKTWSNSPKNDVDDIFITEMMADLGGNSNLSEVDLALNTRITEAGWTSILQFVKNVSSIGALVASNHYLTSIGSNYDQFARIIHEEHTAIRSEIFGELHINKMSISPIHKARRKILSHFLQSFPSPLCQELLNLDVKLMPRIVSMMGKEQNYINYHAVYHLGMLFGLVKHVPSLCAYPSPEKVRMLKIMENEMRAKDAIIEELKRENNELKSGRNSNENKRLRAE